MTVAEYKRAWFLARRAELHARGLKDADIARQMGLQRAYFSQVVGGANVGDGFIDRMCSAFGLRFTPADASSEHETAGSAPPQAAEPQVEYVTIPKALLDDLLGQVRMNTRLLNLALDRIEALTAQLQAPTP